MLEPKKRGVSQVEVSLLPQRIPSELAEGTRKCVLSLVMLLGDIVKRKYPGVRHISGVVSHTERKEASSQKLWSCYLHDTQS